jgi:hypothetical protein
MDLDPIVAGFLRGVEKGVELLLNGTFFDVVQKLAEGYVRCLDAERVKAWLRENRVEVVALPKSCGALPKFSNKMEYSKIFQEGED